MSSYRNKCIRGRELLLLALEGTSSNETCDDDDVMNNDPPLLFSDPVDPAAANMDQEILPLSTAYDQPILYANPVSFSEQQIITLNSVPIIPFTNTATDSSPVTVPEQESTLIISNNNAPLPNNEQTSTTVFQETPSTSSGQLLIDDSNISTDECENDRSLVPYSDSSSGMENLQNKNKKLKKKRSQLKVDKSAWKSEINRKRREKGKSYLGQRKTEDNRDVVEKPRKQLKPPCKCVSKDKGKIQCSKITHNDRKKGFETFWSYTWEEKEVFANGLVKSLSISRKRDRINEDSSRRSSSLFYFLPKEGQQQNIRVCKTMFLHTLCIGESTILKWKKKSNQRITDTTKQTLRYEKENASLKLFFASLPKMEAHYCRASTSKLYLLPEWHNKVDLYKFYAKEWCKEKNERPLSITTFKKEFDNLNLSLYQPKKDKCEVCVMHETGNLSEAEYAAHIDRKLAAREEKRKDKAYEKFLFAVDMQAVLLCPKSNVSSLYYKTKLMVHNYCVYNLNNADGFCYLWNETEGTLSSEEFATIICKFIDSYVVPKIEENDNRRVTFYSDGCTYQNRNATVSNALLNSAIINNITIVQKYLEKGHTQMEVDSMHAKIEKYVKTRNINVPADYVGACMAARNNPRPFIVHYLDHTFFKRMSNVTFHRSIRPGKKAGDPTVMSIKHLEYRPTGEIYYKIKFSETLQILPQRKEQNVIPTSLDNFPPLHSTRNKIKKRKYQDLQELKNSLPADYHQYYDNIPHKDD